MKTEEKVLAEINLPLPVGEVASVLSSLQGVFPDARVKANYSGVQLVVDEEVPDEEPQSEEPAAADSNRIPARY